MIRLTGITVCCLFFSLILKDRNRPIAVVISVFGACLLFYSTVSELRTVIGEMRHIASSLSSVTAYIKLMLKVLGITVLTQLVSDICRDNGENALASMTELSAKIIVIILVLPLFEAVITIVGGLLK